MDGNTAANIVIEYGSALLENETARSISLLSFPKSVIKYAFLTYLESAFTELDEEQIQALTIAYSQLNHFIEDKKAAGLNDLIQKVNNNQVDLSLEENKQKKGVYDSFMKILNSTRDEKEITEFINYLAQINSYDEAM